MFFVLFGALGCALFDSGKIQQTCEDLNACEDVSTIDAVDTAVVDTGADSAIDETGSEEWDTGTDDTGTVEEYIRPTHFSISAKFRMEAGRVLPFEDTDGIFVMLSVERNTDYFDLDDVVCTFSLRSHELAENGEIENMWFVFELRDTPNIVYDDRCFDVDPTLMERLEYNLLYNPVYFGATILNTSSIPLLERYASENIELSVDELMVRTASFAVRTSIDGSETTVYSGVLMGTHMDQIADPEYYFSEREIEQRLDGAYWSIPLRSFSLPSN
ncbi:MAG: hypothetical protein VX278_21755 [Myxococcota bacterium]|nr:hypothetical protein [Myxococcota bacterium]